MKKISKKMIALGLSSLMLFTLAGCSGGSGNDGTIKIGVNYELSGDVAQYGQSSVDGIKMAIEEVNENGGVNGQQIELVEIDNKSDNSEAMSVSTKLADDGVCTILGPATSGAFKATAAVSDKYKVPVISASATADDVTVKNGNVNPYVFRICYNDSFQGKIMGAFASEKLNTKKAIILSDKSNDYSNGLAKAFEEEFKSKGGEVVSTENFSAKDKDFSPVLTKLKSVDADVIYLPGYYTEVGLIIKQAREMGIDLPILGADGYDSPTMPETAGKANLKNVYFTNHYSSDDTAEEVAAFIKGFKAKYDREPDSFNALGYDLGKYIADAVGRAGGTDSEKITEALANTKDFKGVTGTFSMDENHNPVKSTVIIEFKDGMQSFHSRLEAK